MLNTSRSTSYVQKIQRLNPVANYDLQASEPSGGKNTHLSRNPTTGAIRISSKRPNAYGVLKQIEIKPEPNYDYSIYGGP